MKKRKGLVVLWMVCFCFAGCGNRGSVIEATEKTSVMETEELRSTEKVTEYEEDVSDKEVCSINTETQEEEGYYHYSELERMIRKIISD